MYNVENYIDQCLNSLLDQDIDKKDYEIIIINDGSTDNSRLKVNPYSDNYDNINIYDQENRGVSFSRNKGIDVAKGDYLFFIDSDDYIASNTLKQLIDFSNNETLDIIEFETIRTKSRKLNSSITIKVDNSKIIILSGKEYVSSKNFMDSVWAYLYKKDFLLNSTVKFVNGRTMEDMIFNAELIPQANKIGFYPLDVYRYVINPNSIWTSSEPSALRKSIDDFIFMTISYNELINKLSTKNINTNILKQKLQNMLFNIVKRLLKADFKFSEINYVIKELKEHHIYPLNNFGGKDNYRKFLTFTFNHKYLFFCVVKFYRVFENIIYKLIIKKYRIRREKKLQSLINKNSN
jgi:glycosyltransferase involved in cell wall biosynthesis